MSVEIALLLVGVVLVIGLMVLVRLGSLRSEIRELQFREHRNSELLQNLTRRVYVLENRGVSAPERDASPLEVPAVPAQLAAAEPPPTVQVPSSPVEAPAPAAREPRRREDWEVVIGGNWLNKLGVLAIVVGIALFLA